MKILILVCAALAAGCGPARDVPVPTAPAAPDVAQLWRFPDDMAGRDLFVGSGGPALAPEANMRFEFVAEKTSGTNPGYDVRDDQGRLWSVKLGEEAQPEVVTSRLLWAIGFYQPATYYLARWTLSGQHAGPQPDGRFRYEADEQPVIGEWSWYKNPFVGTQPFKGLIVAQLIVNNWDWKTSNNKIYRAPASAGARQLFVVRDLGASLGTAKQSPFFNWLSIRHLQGTKNDLAGFENQPFITGVDDERIEFSYAGLDDSLVRTIQTSDVRWTCELFSRLSDEQWRDAFRAAQYSDDEIARYVRTIKKKIAQGLAL